MLALRALEALAAVARAVDREALRLEPACEEREDSGLVLDDQDPHRSRRATISADDLEMTRE